MLEELHYPDSSRRLLNDKEKLLLRCLLKEANVAHYDEDNIEVIEMKDEGMGSIYFVHKEKRKEERKMDKCIIEKQLFDIDGVPILVSLNVDVDGDLFELDIWKVDFNPVIKYPSC
jgi:hypothetical protein